MGLEDLLRVVFDTDDGGEVDRVRDDDIDEAHGLVAIPAVVREVPGWRLTAGLVPDQADPNRNSRAVGFDEPGEIKRS